MSAANNGTDDEIKQLLRKLLRDNREMKQYIEEHKRSDKKLRAKRSVEEDQFGNECFFFCSACFFVLRVSSVFLFSVFSVLLYKTFIKLRFCFKLVFPPKSQGEASE